MDIKEHTTPGKLEYYSFLWSEARLLVAALALFLGGVPPILFFLSFSPLYGIVSIGLKLAWLISGIASGYLAYRWYSAGQTVFGGKDMKDLIAFGVMVVSGINLGLVGLLGQNIGMSILNSYPVFIVTGILYLAAAYHLYTRWNSRGQKMF